MPKNIRACHCLSPGAVNLIRRGLTVQGWMLVEGLEIFGKCEIAHFHWLFVTWFVQPKYAKAELNQSVLEQKQYYPATQLHQLHSHWAFSNKAVRQLLVLCLCEAHACAAGTCYRGEM